MFNPRIIFPFTRLPDTSFSKKAQSILEAISANPYFPDPSPTPAELKAAISLFNQAIARLKNSSGPKKNSAANEMRVALEEMLVKLAVYVMQTAGGDRDVLASSGFDLAE